MAREAASELHSQPQTPPFPRTSTTNAVGAAYFPVTGAAGLLPMQHARANDTADRYANNKYYDALRLSILFEAF
jgi:hypothetical protein